jgi:NhaA family Na+:H+ antiporter
MRGWAIPAATDIAFSLGVLALLGRRAPLSLKIFLTALAILDDLGAVVIIALFYAHDLSPAMLAGAGAVFAAMCALNQFGVRRLLPYLALAPLLWLFVLQSGVHATIAGVLAAATIPMQGNARGRHVQTPLHRLENALQPFAAYVALPVFGLANAGVALTGLSVTTLMHPVTLGAALGLFLGKQLGVFGGAFIAVRLGLARRPQGAGWLQLYGVSLICGIGFTMSLFIALLAFDTAPGLQDAAKLGVLAGSLVSGLAGWGVLRWAKPRREPASAAVD